MPDEDPHTVELLGLPPEILLIILEILLSIDPITLLGSVPAVCKRLRALCPGVRGEFDLEEDRVRFYKRVSSLDPCPRPEESSIIIGALKAALRFPRTRGLWSFSEFALHYACEAENTKAVVCLLKEDRSKVNYPDDVGNTPLICACKKGNLEIVRMLVENGADVNQENEFMEYPLDFVDSLDSEIVYFLELEQDKAYDRRFSRK